MALINAMNVTQHHPKVGLVLAIPKGPFVSGDEIRGKFTIESRTEKGLGLATIAVELAAVQELTSRDHAAASTFIHTRRLFQGPGLPTSNAVLSEPLPDFPTLPREYSPARKGQTSFFFTFPLPAFAPSSIDFGNGLAKVRYEISAQVEVFWKGERRIVVAQKTVEVVECLPQLREIPPAVIVGEGGKIHLRGRLLGLYAVIGQTACVELFITNHSARKTNGVTLVLTRKLQLRNPGSHQNPFRLTDNLVTIPFNGPEYSVPPSGEGVAHLVFDVPQSAFGAGIGQDESDERARQKLAKLLFSVECEIIVTIGMGLGAPDITFTLPMITAHPEALPSSPPLPEASSPPMVQNTQQMYSPYHAPEAYPPLEPPRALFAQNHYSTPPSPQWSPFHPQSLPSPTPPFYARPPPSQNPYFPQYSSQPATPLQGNFAPLPVFAPPQHASSPQPYQMYPVQQTLPQQWGTPLPVDHGHAALDMGVNPWFSPPPPLPHQVPYQQQQIGSPPPQRQLVSAPIAAPVVVMNNVAPRQEDATSEGKGTRAARVSQHLRYTSRNRSTSPKSHRYPVPITAAALARGSIPLPNAILVAPRSSAVTEPQSPAHSSGSLAVPQSPTVAQFPTGLTQSGAVLSPRPRLSPGLSFDEGTTANGLKVASIKSKRVEDLERMAELVLKEENEQRVGSELEDVTREKTLPAPPAPSGKQIIKSQPVGRPTAADVFGSDVRSVRSLKLATPVPAKVLSTTAIETGLDALERRLAGERADKIDAAERWLARGRRAAPAATKEPESPSGPRPRREPSGPRAEHVEHKREASRDSNSSRKAKESGLPPMPMPRAIEGVRDSHEKEVQRLQKEAVQRVGPWAGAVPMDEDAPELVPWATLSGQAIPKTSSGFVSMKHRPAGGTVAFTELFSQVLSHTPFPPPLSEDSALKAAATATLSPLISSKKFERRLGRQLLGGGAVPTSSYDVRSARGGKGGVVTAVTALWEGAPGSNSAPIAVSPQQQQVRPARRKEAPVFKVPDLPASASHPVVSLSQPPKFSSPTKAGRLFQHSTPVTFDPAVVNGTIAKPYLSSAASIVNSRPRPQMSIDKPPAIPESRSAPQLLRSQSTEPVSPRTESPQIGVGQTKLKELIAKYQSSTTSR